MPFCVNAQIVNIPDANFKAKLLQANINNFIAVNLSGTYFKIDTNSDGEIQQTEALEVSQLYVSGSNISNLTGIEFFVNLQLLNCSNNFLTAIDMSNNAGLLVLYCSSNQLTSLNVSTNTSLNLLHCNSNQLSSLNVSSNTLLADFNCSANQLSSINVSSNSALSNFNCSNNILPSLNVSSNFLLNTLNCNSNQLTSIDVSNNTALVTLYCNFNQLTTLNVTNNLSLAFFDCKNNQLTTLNTNNNSNITYFDSSNNQLTNLDVSNNPQLTYLICNNNQFSSLNVNNNTQLTNLICNNNQLASIDLNTNLALVNLNCSNNLLVTLDTSFNTVLTLLNCSNNLLLGLFIKNGIDNETDFSGNPSLEYICADDVEILGIQTLIDNFGMTVGCTVNSYCSFTLGGDYNTISGVVKFDANDNGCEINDMPQPNIRIDINDGINQGATFTNNTANYNFYTQSGIFTLTPNVENPSWFTFSPNSATIPFADSNNNVVTQNFCIVANGVHPDLEIVIAPITPARPGFDAVYQIVFKNKGNQTLSGNITFTYNDEVSDFVTATPLTATQSLGLLNWNYQNLQPFENRSIYVTLNINSPQESPAVNINDVLSFQVTITPVIGDDMAEDNLFSYNQTVVGSYDPNDITCIEGEVVPPSEIGEYLHYIINFENTGTAEAENIVVKVEVDPTKFDIDSLQMLNTSHNAYIRQAGNKIEFIFQEVWLDTGGHGNVLLKIRSKNNLLEGDAVTKQANIYFDYNSPIETNMASTTFEILSNGNFEIDESITVFPNPTASIININCNNTIKTVELYDVQGRLLQTQIVNSTTTSLDISNKNSGIYFAKITSENGVKVEKISKE